jgi:hypothetical protein
MLVDELDTSKSLPGISPSHEGSSGRPIQPRPHKFGEKNIGYSTSSWVLDDFGGFQWILDEETIWKNTEQRLFSQHRRGLAQIFL